MRSQVDKIFIGLMTGTSADSLDCAAVGFDGEELKIIGLKSYPLPKPIQKKIFYLSSTEEVNESTLKDTDKKLGLFFVEKVREFLKNLSINPKDVSAIGSHGQTIKHDPNSTPPFSIQIGDPQLLCDDLKIITVANFRQGDIEAGGQGAPISPLFHKEVFLSQEKDRVIVNIGGITNITLLSEDRLIGFDSGPGNCLMDLWSRKNGIGFYDKDGNWARSGSVNKKLLKIMISDNFFSRIPPKSTGPDYFGISWLENCLKKLPTDISPENVQATLAELTALSLSSCPSLLKNKSENLYICGGGAHNAFLMERIELLSEKKCLTTLNLGIDPDFLEAICFAWLAKQRVENKKFKMTEVTGSKGEVFLGELYYPVK